MRVCLYHKLGIFRLLIGHLPVELRRDIDIVKDIVFADIRNRQFHILSI